MALTGVEVEFGQAVGGEEWHEEREISHPMSYGVVPQNLHKDEAWSHAAGDDIGERVEFFAQRRSYAEEASGQAVEEVEEDACADEDGSQLDVAFDSKETRQHSGEEVGESYKVGDLFFHFTKVLQSA